MLTTLGIIFLILGTIGSVLPMWPATPLVLVPVACFSSAPHIKAQIMKATIFREHIENYDKKTGLPKKTVQTSLIWLWGTLLISMILIQKFWIITLLILIGVCVTLYLRKITQPDGNKTLKTD